MNSTPTCFIVIKETLPLYGNAVSTLIQSNLEGALWYELQDLSYILFTVLLMVNHHINRGTSKHLCFAKFHFQCYNS